MDRKVIGVKFGGSTFPQDNLYEGFSAATKYAVELYKQGYDPAITVSAPQGMSDLVIEAEGCIDSYKFKPTKSKIVMKAREEAGDENGFDKDRFGRIICDSIMELYSPEANKLGTYGGKLIEKLDKEVEVLKTFLGKGNDQKRKALPENHSGIWLSYMLEDAGLESIYLDGMDVGIKAGFLGMIKIRNSQNAIKESLKGHVGEGKAPVIGGYIGRNIETGEPMLLGRNSGDVTGSVVSGSLGACEYQIIKDVPGVYRIEPVIEVNGDKIRLETSILPSISYDETIQIAGRGSQVVHPEAVHIARGFGMPMRIKDIDIENKGTFISGNPGSTNESPVAAISTGKYYLLSISDPILVHPERSKGYIHRVTGILLSKDVSWADDATPSSVLTIAIPEKYDKKKVDIEGVRDELNLLLREYGYEPTYVGYREAMGISLTGDRMRGTPGVTARIANTLLNECVSISMGTQSDERAGPTAINYYVEKDDFEKAVRALVKELF